MRVGFVIDLFASMPKPKATREAEFTVSSAVFLIMSFHLSFMVEVSFFSLLIISKTHKDRVF